MLSEHKDLKLSNTAFQISEWNPTFPDGDGRSYGSPNLPPCASSLPRSLLLSPWAGISWTSVLGKHSSRTSTAPAPQRTRRDVGTEAAERGREGRKDGGRTENKRVKRKEEGGGRGGAAHRTQNRTAVKTVKDSNMEVVRQLFHQVCKR